MRLQLKRDGAVDLVLRGEYGGGAAHVVGGHRRIAKRVFDVLPCPVGLTPDLGDARQLESDGVGFGRNLQGVGEAVQGAFVVVQAFKRGRQQGMPVGLRRGGADDVVQDGDGFGGGLLGGIGEQQPSGPCDPPAHGLFAGLVFQALDHAADEVRILPGRSGGEDAPLHAGVVGVLVGRFGPGLGRIRRARQFEILRKDGLPSGRVFGGFDRGGQVLQTLVAIARVVGGNRSGKRHSRRDAGGAFGLLIAGLGQPQAMGVAHARQLQKRGIRERLLGVEGLPDLIGRSCRIAVAGQEVGIQRKRSRLERASGLNLLDQLEQLLPSVIGQASGLASDDDGGFRGHADVVGSQFQRLHSELDGFGPVSHGGRQGGGPDGRFRPGRRVLPGMLPGT